MAVLSSKMNLHDESTKPQNGSIDQQSSTTASGSANRLKSERVFLLSGIQVFAYSVGHIHNDICSAIWFTYLLVFMQFVLKFDATTAGLLLLIGQIADGIATPIVGLVSDRNVDSCHTYGKRKTWHLIGTVASVLSFPFIFQPCYWGEHCSKSVLIFYYAIFITVFQFAWAAIQINHMSMATDLSPYSCERVKLTVRRSSFTVISNILVYLFAWFVLHMNNENDHNSQFSPKDTDHFRLIVFTLVGVGVMFTVFFHIFICEKPHNVQIRQKNNNSNTIDYSDRSNHLQWKHWFRYGIFYQVALLYMFSRLVVNLTQVFIPLYLHHALEMSKVSVAYIPLMIYCSGFVGSFLVEFANKRFNNIQILFVGSFVSLCAFIWIFYGTNASFVRIEIYFVSALIGLSGQIININSQSILNDMIGQNTASSAFVFGFMSFLDKFSNGAAVMTIQVMADSKSYEHYKPFYRYVLTSLCGSASIISIIILLIIWQHNFDNDLSRSRLSNSNVTIIEKKDHEQTSIKLSN